MILKNRLKRWTIDRSSLQTIGTGTFARVCLAKQKGSHKWDLVVSIVMVTLSLSHQRGCNGHMIIATFQIMTIATLLDPRLFGLHPNGLFTFGLSLFDYKAIWTSSSWTTKTLPIALLVYLDYTPNGLHPFRLFLTVQCIFL